MTKTEFIAELKPVLKEMGYRKTNHYWHRACGDLIACVFVQGSNWDTNDYYVEVGWALPDENRMKPTLLYWYCRGRIGGVNPEPWLLLEFLKGRAAQVTDRGTLCRYLQQTGAKGMLGHYWFEPNG